jgi:hypothetical protein
MKTRGLIPTPISSEEKEKLNSALAEVFKWKEKKRNESNSLE